MPPKLFISYSWTNQRHVDWVIDLAEQLMEFGVEVILDKWDLREGNDAHAFMESMVRDPEIKKVLLICDSTYVEKANNRKGGVGTESQIITPEIYSQKDQSKFVAVVTDHDESGEPYLPIYYRSRIYIDLSNATTCAENFEKLVRWAYDEPLYKKPALGQKPVYLKEDQLAVTLGTSARLTRAIDAIRNGRPHAIASASEFFDTFAIEFEKFRLNPQTTPFDDAVIASIENFGPYRNQVISVISALSRHCDAILITTPIHRFFEKLLPFLDRPPATNQWRDIDFDNFRFVVREMFLYTLAILIKHERFEVAHAMLENDYYFFDGAYSGRRQMVPYTIFDKPIHSLEERNRRLGTRRFSLHADLLKERCNYAEIELRHLMQADLILYIRSHAVHTEMQTWWPVTFSSMDHGGPLEIFARSVSASYFDKVKMLVGVADKAALVAVIEGLEEARGAFPRWPFSQFNPRELLNIERLERKP